MHFITSFTSLLLASVAFASPIDHEARDLASRDLCHAGVPCVVQYEVNVALKAVDQAVVMVQADAKAVLAPTGPLVISLSASAQALIKVAAELSAEVGPLVGEAKVELQGYVVAAIAVLVTEIRAGVSVIASVSAKAGATASPQVQAASDAVLNAIIAIEAFVGPCDVPST